MPVATLTFPFPVLHGTLIRIIFEHLDQPPLYVLLRPKLEASHALDDLFINFIRSKGLAVEHVRVRWATVPARHPWVRKDF